MLNHNKTFRLYRADSLLVRTKKRKRLSDRERLPLSVPQHRNQRWSMDFASDSLCSGRRFRVHNIVDDHSRESPCQLVDFSISGERVGSFLDQLAILHGLTDELVINNGPGLPEKPCSYGRRKPVCAWCSSSPASQCRMVMLRAVPGKFRYECPNENWLVSLSKARPSLANDIITIITNVHTLAWAARHRRRLQPNDKAGPVVA